MELPARGGSDYIREASYVCSNTEVVASSKERKEHQREVHREQLRMIQHQESDDHHSQPRAA